MEVTERSVAAVGTVLCLTFDISKKSIILRWKSHAPPLLSVLCVCVRWCHSLARPHLSSTSCCFILALWKYVPVAAVISRWVGDVDFSVCVLPYWPFLWQSISVKAVRTSRVIQREIKITAGRYLGSRRLVASIPISSGWLVPQLPECEKLLSPDITANWNEGASRSQRSLEMSLRAALEGSFPGLNLTHSWTGDTSAFILFP